MRDGGRGDLFDLALPVPHVSMVVSAKAVCLKGAVVAGRERGVREEVDGLKASLSSVLFAWLRDCGTRCSSVAVCGLFGLKTYLLVLAVQVF